jgi:hypothetical protein
MSDVHGNAGSHSATVMRPEQQRAIGGTDSRTTSAQVMPPSPRPTMNKHNSNHEPRRRSLVNTQRTRKETRPEISSGHVAPTSHAHEQVTSTMTVDQRTREPGSHQ